MILNKNIKSLTYIFIFFVLSTSCNKGNKRYNSLYNYELKTFKKEFVSHIPKKTNPAFSYSINKDGKYSPVGIEIYEKENKNFYSVFHDSIKKISKASYKSTDKCLLVINMFITEKNIFDKTKANSQELKILDDACLSDKLPVPNFWSRDSKFETRCNLSENFELFVLDAKSGIYWDKKYLTNEKYMPEKWKHGYSKGIAMNNKTFEIIYWFQIW